MRYLVSARLKPGQAVPLMKAIEKGYLGAGSVAGGEYLRNMMEARKLSDGTVFWIEVCFCPTPLQEERPYWEKHFELLHIRNAHNREKCRDFNGSEPWACSDCACTERLESKITSRGKNFLLELENESDKIITSK